jgi:hypothetical protein
LLLSFFFNEIKATIVCDCCGFRTKYESCAKKIKRFIDSKAKIIINHINNDENLDNNESIDELQ